MASPSSRDKSLSRAENPSSRDRDHSSKNKVRDRDRSPNKVTGLNKVESPSSRDRDRRNKVNKDHRVRDRRSNKSPSSKNHKLDR